MSTQRVDRTPHDAAGSGLPGPVIPPPLLDLLRCPSCDSQVHLSDSLIVCGGCQQEYPVQGGIPRFVTRLDAVAARTQASFGYEWTHFTDWTASGDTNFQTYFGDLDLSRLSGARVLDAGCGMGRHARMLAPHVGFLVALDFSAAIDQAARTVAGCRNVGCIQANLAAPPLRSDSFDFVYSLGVLHHLDDTSGGLARLVRLVKPGGKLRVYLYWQHAGWRGLVLRLVGAARWLTTRLPFTVLRRLCWVLSAALWVGVLLPYRLLWRLGARGVSRMPYFQYTAYPFTVLYNDQFDRFSAPLEARYTAEEVRRLLEQAGLLDVRVWPRYGWMAEGVRPGSPGKRR